MKTLLRKEGAEASWKLKAGAAAFNATFQYIGNTAKHGFGADNFENINVTGVAMTYLNPFSVGTNAVVSNFGKITIAGGAQQAVGGSQFNLGDASLGAAIDFAGGKLGGSVEKFSGTYLDMSAPQAKVLGDVLGGTAATPANVIKDAATDKKDTTGNP